MNPAVNRLKEEIEHLIQGIGSGEKTVRYLEKFKDSLKYLVIPGISLEELGFPILARWTGITSATWFRSSGTPRGAAGRCSSMC